MRLRFELYCWLSGLNIFIIDLLKIFNNLNDVLAAKFPFIMKLCFSSTRNMNSPRFNMDNNGTSQNNGSLRSDQES